MRRISLRFLAIATLALLANTGYGQETPRRADLAQLWPVPSLADLVPHAITSEDAGQLMPEFLELRWDTFPVPQFANMPPTTTPPVVTMQGSTERTDNQQVIKLGFATAPRPAPETPAFHVEASVTSRDNAVQHSSVQRRTNVQNVAVSAQTALPRLLHGWYVKVVGRAAPTSSEQLGVSVGREHPLASGARIAYSIGLTQRQAHPLQHLGSHLVNWTLQWKWSERLSADLRCDYDPEMNSIDTLLSLNVQSRVPR